jgi:hypothetical protein
MSHPNRVTPFGEVLALPERGTMMGNRGGCFHTADKTLTRRRWVNRRWIVCLLEFAGRRREVMAPGRYTELFFLDEATALAAGHRPCAECRRGAFRQFTDAWLRGNAGHGLGPGCGIDAIDRVLHAGRVSGGGGKVVYRAPLGELPDGAFVCPDATPGVAWLVRGGRLWPWGPGGYGPASRLDAGEEAAVLTPRSTVAALGAGYAPGVHPSAG